MPLYSRWRAIDTWGLNDQWIAHNGAITEKYLASQKPDVVMWHGYFSPCHLPAPDRSPWDLHVLTLKNYVEQVHFTLAAAFGPSPEEAHYYYVRSDLPDRDEIVERIRSISYTWWQTGNKAQNYADVCPRRRS